MSVLLDHAAAAPAGEVARLKAKIARFERGAGPGGWGAIAFGDARLDARLSGGLALGQLHEIGGVGAERENPAAAAGFAALIAARAAREGALLWVLQRDDLHAPGLAGFGVDPDRLIFVRADKDEAVLAAAEDSLRTRGVGAVIAEIAALDLTAGRRLQLACERHGATALALRRRLYGAARAHVAETSAATTRWSIAAAPSVSDEPGLGAPRWIARLERCRGGRAGAWLLEADDAQATGAIRVVAELADHAAEAGDEGGSQAQRAAGLRHHGDDGKRLALGGG
jgi:protein ImuA